jgi:hypothetical protein
MTQSDFTAQLLGQILESEKELFICAPEYREMVITRRNAFIDVLRAALKDKEAIENAQSILGELRAVSVESEISNIMGVNYARRND